MLFSFHKRNKPFKCEVCDYRFARKGDLNQHVASFHDGKKCRCTTKYALLYANYISFSEGTMAKFALKGHEQTLFRHFPVVLIYAEATFEKLLNYTNNSSG